MVIIAGCPGSLPISAPVDEAIHHLDGAVHVCICVYGQYLLNYMTFKSRYLTCWFIVTIFVKFKGQRSKFTEYENLFWMHVMWKDESTLANKQI